MPTYLILILGIVQGLTEFLPVSSSGHLVLAQHFLPGFSEPPVAFDVTLHLGTLLSLIVFFRKDIIQMLKSFFIKKGDENASSRWLALMIIAGSVPTGLIGIAFEDVFEGLFGNHTLVPFMFAVTGILLFAAERVKARRKEEIKRIGLKEALIIGLVQGIAIIPGISRSGATISTGLVLGASRNEAARFSFLLSIPAVAGAFLLKVHEIEIFDFHYIFGALIAAFVGIFAIYLTLKIVLFKRLWIFSAYLLCASIVLIIINFIY